MSTTLGGVDEILPFVFSDGNGLVAVLAGYFDESERPEGHEPICVAGFVFSPGEYKKFRRYWQSNVLRYRGRRFNAFHMTDLVSGKDEYKGLSIADRLVILNHAIHAIQHNARMGVAVHFSQAEFERKAPANWPDIFGSIYTAACGMCLQTTGYWLTQWGCQMDVLYVFEKGHKFRAQADEFLTNFGLDEEMRQRCRYRNHMFELKAEPGLQAADLSAWTVTKAMLLNGSAPRSLRPFAEPMLRFAGCLGDRYKLYPFQGERLDRFLNEMTTRPMKVFERRGNYPDGLR